MSNSIFTRLELMSAVCAELTETFTIKYMSTKASVIAQWLKLHPDYKFSCMVNGSPVIVELVKNNFIVIDYGDDRRMGLSNDLTVSELMLQTHDDDLTLQIAVDAGAIIVNALHQLDPRDDLNTQAAPTLVYDTGLLNQYVSKGKEVGDLLLKWLKKNYNLELDNMMIGCIGDCTITKDHLTTPIHITFNPYSKDVPFGYVRITISSDNVILTRVYELILSVDTGVLSLYEEVLDLGTRHVIEQGRQYSVVDNEPTVVPDMDLTMLKANISDLSLIHYLNVTGKDIIDVLSRTKHNMLGTTQNGTNVLIKKVNVNVLICLDNELTVTVSEEQTVGDVFVIAINKDRDNITLINKAHAMCGVLSAIIPK